MPRQEGLLKKTMSLDPAGTTKTGNKYALLVLLAALVVGPGLAQDVDGGRATYHGYWVANSGEVACPVQLIDPLGQATWYWGTFTMSFVHETFPSDWAGTTGDCFEPQNGTISGLSRD